ncbi:hypothetical protein STEG23_036065 [Scotinomys teguina]
MVVVVVPPLGTAALGPGPGPLQPWVLAPCSPGSWPWSLAALGPGPGPLQPWILALVPFSRVGEESKPPASSLRKLLHHRDHLESVLLRCVTEKSLFIFSDTDRALLTQAPEDTRTHHLIISSRKFPGPPFPTLPPPDIYPHYPTTARLTYCVAAATTQLWDLSLTCGKDELAKQTDRQTETHVEKLVKCLDPNDLGRINFKDFCRGVFAMKGCEELLKDVLSVESAGTLPCSPEIPDCVEQFTRRDLLGEILKDVTHACTHARGLLSETPQPGPVFSALAARWNQERAVKKRQFGRCPLAKVWGWPNAFSVLQNQSDGFSAKEGSIPGMQPYQELPPLTDLTRNSPAKLSKQSCNSVGFDQGSGISSSTFADGELLPREPGFFQEDEEEAMTLAVPEGPQELEMDSPMESSQGLEGSVRCPVEEKEPELGGLILPEDKSLVLTPSMTTSDLSTHSTASLISNEEQFEDYGEGDDVDCTPSSPCPDDETRTNVYSDLGSSVSSSAGQTPRKMRHVYHSELLDVYCSQCCKKINLLNDLEARLKNLKANSPNRKISSTAFGRQLMYSSNFSSSNGSTEDLFRDSIDSCDNDITEKVSFLEKKVTELENDSVTSGDLKSKLKQENMQLVHRVQQLEEENTDLRTTVTRLKSQTEKLDEERQRMSDRLEDTSLRLKDETDLYKRMMDKLRQNRLEFQKEREATQELIEDLRRELEHLQMYKLDCERPGRGRSSSGLSEFNARAREVELEHEVKRLKQENHKLRDQNDDLNGQILSLSLYEAKNLFATQTKAQSLAAEIDTASRDELMEALKEQEEINFRLRQYMDKIILAILDHNPSILEIKH